MAKSGLLTPLSPLLNDPLSDFVPHLLALLLCPAFLPLPWLPVYPSGQAVQKVLSVLGFHAAHTTRSPLNLIACGTG